MARNPQIRLKSESNFLLNKNEHIAVVGANGSGKTHLINMICGNAPLNKGSIEYDFSPSNSNLAYENIKSIAFKDTYGAADANYYYQQRWNSMEQDDIPTVGEQLGKDLDISSSHIKELYSLFGINDFLDKKVISLSSGELRKFQLIKTLSASPRVLIIDNPFIGLDTPSRNLLQKALSRLSHSGDIQIILVLSMVDDIPDFITHVVTVDNLIVGEKVERSQYLKQLTINTDKDCFEKLESMINNIEEDFEPLKSDDIINMNNITIKYGERTILKDLSWNVKRGEKWALSGENGAGKSTLLSLVCADNPQSYACNISLFGNKRGSGESIWEIKKHIGYVSPEMHRAYRENLPTIEIVASGLHDSIGLYKRPKPEQMGICNLWMDIFGILKYRDIPFLQLSSGEQRLALLARAFVKDPELLILDEPLHGLDTWNRMRVKFIIESFCKRKDKTLIMVTHYQNELPNSITNSKFLKKNN
ncbi:MAG: ATP-binding cassette domain-containing protein [Bacteroidales bacterium]|nr:ATP-binding cassette domain-containing protein [Bacteroidales bacterium]